MRHVVLCGSLCGLLVAGCGLSGPGADDDQGGPSHDGTTAGQGGAAAGVGGAGTGSSTGSGAGGNSSCATPQVSSSAARPVDLMSSGELAKYVERLPCVADVELVRILESPDTMFYDSASIVPGYQDSYGNGQDFPVGMRPNTIQANLIDLAVPGGHAQLFESKGLFHFPFGNPIDVAPGDAVVIDFWHVPRGEGGELLPVVWWWYEPSGWTHRIKWSFPAGTVFGELMFVVGEGGALFPFEIRTRTREVEQWVVDAHRPFPEATDFAAALEASGAADVGGLVAHLMDSATLQPASLGASHYADAFPMSEGAVDVLPALNDNSVIENLLLERGFVSAKGKVWKTNGSLTAYAATSDSAFSIVPRNYNAGLVPVTDESCGRCHQDAGRPFKDYYFNVLAYGELWGEDETFTWHPFEATSFVGSTGDVVGFNNDNRQMRADFVAGGVLEPYEASQHPTSIYKEIDRPWRNYVHY